MSLERFMATMYHAIARLIHVTPCTHWPSLMHSCFDEHDPFLAIRRLDQERPSVCLTRLRERQATRDQDPDRSVSEGGATDRLSMPSPATRRPGSADGIVPDYGGNIDSSRRGAMHE
jgi:hypothetical protein